MAGSSSLVSAWCVFQTPGFSLGHCKQLESKLTQMKTICLSQSYLSLLIDQSLSKKNSTSYLYGPGTSLVTQSLVMSKARFWTCGTVPSIAFSHRWGIPPFHCPLQWLLLHKQASTIKELIFGLIYSMWPAVSLLASPALREWLCR